PLASPSRAQPASSPMFGSMWTVAILAILTAAGAFWFYRPKPSPPAAVTLLVRALDNRGWNASDRAVRIAELARIAPENDADTLTVLRQQLYVLAGSKEDAALLLRTVVATHVGPVRMVMFSPDSAFIVSSGDDLSLRINGADGQLTGGSSAGKGPLFAL